MTEPLGLVATIVPPPGSSQTLADGIVALAVRIPNDDARADLLRQVEQSKTDILAAYEGGASADGRQLNLDVRVSFPAFDWTLVLRCDIAATSVERVEALSHAEKLLVLVQFVRSLDDLTPDGDALALSLLAPPDDRGHVAELLKRRRGLASAGA